MLTGRFEQDSKGFRIRTSDVMSSEPTIITSLWRVTALNGETPEDGTLAIYANGRWRVGTRAECATEERPEVIEKAPIKPPKGKRGRVEWRDGSWHKRTAYVTALEG